MPARQQQFHCDLTRILHRTARLPVLLPPGGISRKPGRTRARHAPGAEGGARHPEQRSASTHRKLVIIVIRDLHLSRLN
jgi:hypothetical protein